MFSPSSAGAGASLPKTSSFRNSSAIVVYSHEIVSGPINAEKVQDIAAKAVILGNTEILGMILANNRVTFMTARSKAISTFAIDQKNILQYEYALAVRETESELRACATQSELTSYFSGLDKKFIDEKIQNLRNFLESSEEKKYYSDADKRLEIETYNELLSQFMRNNPYKSKISSGKTHEDNIKAILLAANDTPFAAGQSWANDNLQKLYRDRHKEVTTIFERLRATEASAKREKTESSSTLPFNAEAFRFEDHLGIYEANLHVNDTIDVYGNTLLHTAVNKSAHKITKFLVEMKADVSKKNNDGKSAQELAIDSGDIHAISLLFSASPLATHANTLIQFFEYIKTNIDPKLDEGINEYAPKLEEKLKKEPETDITKQRKDFFEAIKKHIETLRDFFSKERADITSNYTEQYSKFIAAVEQITSQIEKMSAERKVKAFIKSLASNDLLEKYEVIAKDIRGRLPKAVEALDIIKKQKYASFGTGSEFTRKAHEIAEMGSDTQIIAFGADARALEEARLMSRLAESVKSTEGLMKLSRDLAEENKKLKTENSDLKQKHEELEAKYRQVEAQLKKAMSVITHLKGDKTGDKASNATVLSSTGRTNVMKTSVEPS